LRRNLGRKGRARWRGLPDHIVLRHAAHGHARLLVRDIRLRNGRGTRRRPRTYHVYYLGDFDHAGQDAGNSLREKLDCFADEEGIDLVFKQIAVTRKQIADWNLLTREPKRKSTADKKWPHDFGCELDAIPPDLLRDLVETYINLHLPQDKLEVLKVVENSERKIIAKLVGGLAS